MDDRNRLKLLAKELKKNTDIMEMTFAKYNLQVLQYAYHPYGEDDADCELIIEVMSADGNAMAEDAGIKINLYDDAGEIFFTAGQFVDADEFAGYDTFKICLYNNSSTLLEAKSARIYMSKS